MVVYRSAFRRILEADFGSADVADEFLSRVLPNKMVIFPFISVQRDFGYSDITASNNRPGEITCHFRNAEEKERLTSASSKNTDYTDNRIIASPGKL